MGSAISEPCLLRKKLTEELKGNDHFVVISL